MLNVSEAPRKFSFHILAWLPHRFNVFRLIKFGKGVHESDKMFVASRYSLITASLNKLLNNRVINNTII